MVKNFRHWISDYLHAARKHTVTFFIKPPKHFLGYIEEGKVPIVLIPGIYEKWHFLKAIADPLSLRGHPIYVLERIGYNTKEISHTAQLIRELIEEKDLQNVVLIAHSKGGLIGKYLLVFHNQDNRVKKLIAIATPFGGSHIVKFIPHRAAKELSPTSKAIQDLQKEKEVNKLIVSIYGIFDNHVWPETSCYLKGANNIQVNTHGHHKILFDKKVREIVMSEARKV